MTSQQPDDSTTEVVQRLEAHVAKNHGRLLSMIRGWISAPSVAEDLLQDSFVKALRAAPQLEDIARLEGWFHQILRNTARDLMRKQQREDAGNRELVEEVGEGWEPEFASNICQCLHDVLAELKPEQGRLIEDLELGDVEPEDAARELGITRNNLKVRRHRARHQLRDRLEQTCGSCAGAGCLDCTCS